MLAMLVPALVTASLALPSARADEPAIFSGQIKEVSALAFSPDGNWLATGGLEGEVVLWAANSCLGEHRLGKHDGAVQALAFSRDGRFLATGDLYKSVKLFALGGAGDAIEPKEVHSWKIDGAIDSLAFSFDGELLLVGSHDNALLIHSTHADRRAAEPLKIVHEYEVLAIAVARDGGVFATGDGGGNVRVFETKDAKPLVDTKLAARVTALQFSESGDTLFCAAADAGVLALATKSLEPRSEFSPLVCEANCLALSPDGKKLFVGTQDALVKIVNCADGKVLRTLEGHEGPLLSMSVAPDGSPLASASRDRSMRVWTLER